MGFWDDTPPVFFIGMPRSGTTVLFEAFARHSDLAWPSNYSKWYPCLPWMNCLRRLQDNAFWRIDARKGEFGKTMPGNRFFVQPDEAYSFWNAATGIDFAGDFLAGATADSDSAERVRRVCLATVRAQGRRMFSAKLTGPPRIGYLNSIFPNARFVHVVRDGRAVVRSLLKVAFWRDGGGFENPFWQGGLTSGEMDAWRRDGSDPGLLAAMQWSRVVRETGAESERLDADRFHEVRYEDYIEDPIGVMEGLVGFAGLSGIDRVREYLEKAPKLVNMNHQFRNEWDEDYIRRLNERLEPHISEYGYV